LYESGIYHNREDEGQSIPLEILILTAAKGDPLRAQEIEENLTPDWWEWWLADYRAQLHGATHRKPNGG
jgi:hypothetical protein